MESFTLADLGGETVSVVCVEIMASLLSSSHVRAADFDHNTNIAAICIQELSPTTIATGASPKNMIKKEKRSQSPHKIHLTKPQPPIITRLRQSRRPRGMLIREIEQQLIIITRSRSRISPRRWRPIDPPHRRRRPLGRE